MMKPLLPLLPLLLSALPGAVLAQATPEREWIPYRQIVEMIRLEKFQALPAADRDKLDLFLHVKPSTASVDLRAVRLTAVHGGSRIPLPIDAAGNIRLPLNPAWLAEDVRIMTNQPKEAKLSAGPGMNAVMPPGTQWTYGALMGSVKQSNAAIGKMAGALSMFAPTIKSVLLKFDQPAQVTVQSKAGPRLYATDGKHQIRLKPDSALLAENPPMALTARPWEAELDTE